MSHKIRPLYKAKGPFQEIPKGHGYLGVLMYDEEDDSVQCHICGKFFPALGAHLKSHHVKADDYRQDHGLNFNIALCGKRMSSVRRDEAQENFTHNRKSRPKPKRGKRSVPRQEGTQTIAQQNKFGLCDLQMRARYEVIKKIAKRVPTEAEIKNHDHALYSAIERRFETLNNFRRVVGDKQMSISDYHSIDDIELIAAIRKKSDELGRAPRTRDFQKATDEYPYYGTILNHFGGWVTALRIAGLGERFSL